MSKWTKLFQKTAMITLFVKNLKPFDFGDLYGRRFYMINDLIFKAQQGDAQAQFELARCYYNGDKIEQDYQKALDWFKKSAEQGHAEAQFEFGLCYYDGCLVKQDAKKAVEWLEKSA